MSKRDEELEDFSDVMPMGGEVLGLYTKRRKRQRAFGSAGGSPPVEGGGGVGSPMGLLLSLTYSS